MDLKGYKGALEALLFASGEPVSIEKLAECLEIETSLVERLIRSIEDDLEEPDRGLMLVRLNNKYQFTTKIQFSEYVKSLLDTRRNTPLSTAALEVLAVVAYNQPVSRSFIDQVRGVDSTTVLQTLVSKGLVDEAGRLDLPGKPISYKTTDVFLRTFGFSSLQNLPPIHGDAEETEKEAAEELPSEAELQTETDVLEEANEYAVVSESGDENTIVEEA